MKSCSSVRALVATLVLAAAAAACLGQGAALAQDDPGEASLGDVARKYRAQKTAPPPEVVVDNDNFSKVVAEAEHQKANGAATTMVFSLDPGGKNFQVSSPDVSCSFSFSAKTSSLLADPAMLDELPRTELAKLDGPATLNGDSLQVSVHNGTAWQLRELTIGLTILRRPDGQASSSGLGRAHLTPAVDEANSVSVESAQKQPDLTVLLRVKGSAAPSTTALFRTQLNFALFPDQEWHWAIVKAKGIAPPTGPPAGSPPPAPTATPDRAPASSTPPQ